MLTAAASRPSAPCSQRRSHLDRGGGLGHADLSQTPSCAPHITWRTSLDHSDDVGHGVGNPTRAQGLGRRVLDLGLNIVEQGAKSSDLDRAKAFAIEQECSDGTLPGIRAEQMAG